MERDLIGAFGFVQCYFVNTNDYLPDYFFVLVIALSRYLLLSSFII